MRRRRRAGVSKADRAFAGPRKKNRRAGGAADVDRQMVERAIARARERLAPRGTPRK